MHLLHKHRPASVGLQWGANILWVTTFAHGKQWRVLKGVLNHTLHIKALYIYDGLIFFYKYYLFFNGIIKLLPNPKITLVVDLNWYNNYFLTANIIWFYF